MAELRGYPRIASCDSQAYGVQARQTAYRQRRPKTNALLAACMTESLRQQNKHASAPGFAFRAPRTPLPEARARLLDPIEARIAAASKQLRELHEAGEIDWNTVHPSAAYEMAFLDD